MTSPGPIGGYFGLELPPPKALPYPGTAGFQSARAAFAALLHAIQPSAVWMPTYICDSMLQPLLTAGIPVRYYGLARDFQIQDGVRLGDGEILLYVDYFGVCAAPKAAAAKRFGAGRLVLDHSQSFYSAPDDTALATVYSLRKFFGVPDGGLLSTRAAIGPPPGTDSGSLARSEHLLRRHAGPVTEGYEAFKRAEATLEELEPRGMSLLTSRILRSVDFEAARVRRNVNFRYFHERLGPGNELKMDFGAVDGPLSYPLLTNMPLRERLLRNEIYVPCYWPEVLERASPGSFEHDMAERCVPLPCDQRYTPSDLARVVDVVRVK